MTTTATVIALFVETLPHHGHSIFFYTYNFMARIVEEASADFAKEKRRKKSKIIAINHFHVPNF
jgi:hypothetical protein